MDQETSVNEKKQVNNQKTDFVKYFLDGSILTRDSVVRQLPFILFLTLMAILYIANRFNAEKLVRETVRSQNEVRELRSESISIASELMFISKQTEVAKLVEQNGLDLKEATIPPKQIKARKK
jgi:hypothetical protein